MGRRCPAWATVPTHPGERVIDERLRDIQGEIITSKRHVSPITPCGAWLKSISNQKKETESRYHYLSLYYYYWKGETGHLPLKNFLVCWEGVDFGTEG